MCGFYGVAFLYRYPGVASMERAKGHTNSSTDIVDNRQEYINGHKHLHCLFH